MSQSFMQRYYGQYNAYSNGITSNNQNIIQEPVTHVAKPNNLTATKSKIEYQQPEKFEKIIRSKTAGSAGSKDKIVVPKIEVSTAFTITRTYLDLKRIITEMRLQNQK